MRANWKVKVLKKVVQDILEQERNVETRTGENWSTQGGSISLDIKKKKGGRESKQKWAKGCCLNFNLSKGAPVVLELICFYNHCLSKVLF